MGTFTVNVISLKILPNTRIVEKTSVRVSWSLVVDRCVTTAEYVRIVYRNRLLIWIKLCCYVERYSPLDLFEPASGVIGIPQQVFRKLHACFICHSFFW